MEIEFYFDPSCPWCWITSRWLNLVAQHRELTIDWLPFSLALKNDELSGGNSSGYSGAHLISHKVLRVIETVHEKEGLERGVLYTAFGKAHFIEGVATDKIISNVLDKLKIESSYAKQADNTNLDKSLKAHFKNALSVVGDDVGVPTIIFTDSDSGTKTGFFGPVITEMPSLEESLNLWDGLSKLAGSKNFYELKRSRTAGPKVETTAT